MSRGAPGPCLTWTVSVDSTTVRAHQAAAGARKTPVPGEPADHALGRSRAGRTTKIHLAADTSQAVLSFTLTVGQRGDSAQVQPVLERITVPSLGPGRPRAHPRKVLADKVYPFRANRAYLRRRGITAVIPEKKDQRRNRAAKARRDRRPPAFDKETYKERNTIDGPSAGSSATAPSRPGSTSSPSATRPPSKSRSSSTAPHILKRGPIGSWHDDRDHPRNDDQTRGRG